MAIEIFNRQELKFVVSQTQYEVILPSIREHMRLDRHNADGQPYRLYNLYIDTADRALIRHSMSKPTVYKEKIRIRSYQPLTPDSLVFLEVKKRYKKITNKRRTKIPLSDALAFIQTGTLPNLHGYMNPQVISEFAVMLQEHYYQPTTYICYDRMAFHARDKASDLRMTFDTNLVSQQYGTSDKQRLLAADKLIMEVKSTTNMPLWLVELLDKHHIYKQSFSKYGTEHMMALQASEVVYA
ncbi:MAG TPA: polyphosphate polymerase domain-containing protein [Candidatus Saccharibacteria bacterium]|nr:polyphosphate polymerase domain-containing protein [Candidatus Saccharibacteria bacterium]